MHVKLKTKFLKAIEVLTQKFSLGILCTSTVHDAKMIMFF